MRWRAGTPDLNTASVPILLPRIAGFPVPPSFKYSFCSYSTRSMWNGTSMGSVFKYSFCSYSTEIPGSMQRWYGNLNTASVPILPPVVTDWAAV